MAGEQFTFSAAIDPSFEAATRLMSDDVKKVWKDWATLHRDFLKGNRDTISSEEELVEKLSEHIVVVRGIVDEQRKRQQATEAALKADNMLADAGEKERQRLEILQKIREEQQKVRDAVEQTTAIERAAERAAFEARGGIQGRGYEDPNAGYALALKQEADRKRSNAAQFAAELEQQTQAELTNAARQKEIADDVTKYSKEKFAEKFSAYSASWRQTLDLDEEEKKAKIENDAAAARLNEHYRAVDLSDAKAKAAARLEIERELRDFQFKFQDEIAARDKMQYQADSLPGGSHKAEAIVRLKMEMRELSQVERQLQKDFEVAMDAAAGGSDKARVAAVKLEEVLLGVRKRYHELNRELEAKDGFRGARMMFTEGARGAQDFLTVLAMPGMGLNDAFRAASNNIEVMAMSIKGLNMGFVVGLTMLPSLIQGGMALFHWMNKEAEATKKATEERAKHQDAIAKSVSGIKDYNNHIQTMNSLQGDSKDRLGELVEYEGRLVDVRRQSMIEETANALSGVQSRISSIEKEKKSAKAEMDEAKRLMETTRGRAGEQQFIRAQERYEAAIAKNKELHDLMLEEDVLKDKIGRTEKEHKASITKAASEKKMSARSEVSAELAKLAAKEAMKTGDVDTAADKIIWESGIVPKNAEEYAYIKNKMIDVTKDEISKAESKKLKDDMRPELEKRRAAKEERRRIIADKLELGGFDDNVQKAKDAQADFDEIIKEEAAKNKGNKPHHIGKTLVKEEEAKLKAATEKAERERRKEQRRLESEFDAKGSASLEGILNGINELVRMERENSSSSYSAVQPRNRVFGMRTYNPDSSAFPDNLT